VTTKPPRAPPAPGCTQSPHGIPLACGGGRLEIIFICTAPLPFWKQLFKVLAHSLVRARCHSQVVYGGRWPRRGRERPACRRWWGWGVSLPFVGGQWEMKRYGLTARSWKRRLPPGQEIEGKLMSGGCRQEQREPQTLTSPPLTERRGFIIL